MPSKVFLDEIYEIIVGQDMNGIKYRVGSPIAHGRSEIISCIEEEENSYVLSGVTRYHIYVEVDGEEKIWRRIENVPVIVTCNL